MLFTAEVHGRTVTVYEPDGRKARRVHWLDTKARTMEVYVEDPQHPGKLLTEVVSAVGFKYQVEDGPIVTLD